MKKRFAASLLFLIFAVAILVTAIVAWFIPSARFNNIIITTGNVNSEVTLFYYHDFDHDGFIDIMDGDYIDEEITVGHIKNMKPGDYYFYRLEIKNTGTMTGILKISFIFPTDGGVYLGDLMSHKSSLALTPGDITDRDLNRASNYFTEYLNIESNLINVNATRSVYFSIKFEMFEFLTANSVPAVSAAGFDFNDYQSIDLSTMKIVVTLEQAEPDLI